MTIETEQVHGTCVAMPGGKIARGVLILGPSGAGKSDLALRLIDTGWQLVADDRVHLASVDDQLIARCPQKIRGILEVRGVGLVSAVSASSARLVLAISLTGSVPRLPEKREFSACGASIPLLHLNALEASTPAKVRIAVNALDQGVIEGVTFPFEES